MGLTSNKKTPKISDQIPSATSSEKKLIQARLPFKTVTGSEKESSNVNQDVRKRKLSYSKSPSPNRRSKDNLPETAKKSKTVVETNGSETHVDLIILEDETLDEPIEIHEKDPKNGSTKRKSETKTDDVSKTKGESPKVRIKLPTNKKKRRKMNRHQPAKECSDSSDDVEIIEMNPQKKTKQAIIKGSGDDIQNEVVANLIPSSSETGNCPQNTATVLCDISENKEVTDKENNDKSESNAQTECSSKQTSQTPDEPAVLEINSDSDTEKVKEIDKCELNKDTLSEKPTKSKLKTLDTFVSKGVKNDPENPAKSLLKDSKPKEKIKKKLEKDSQASNRKNKKIDSKVIPEPQCKTDNETDINDDDDLELSSSPGPSSSKIDNLPEKSNKTTEKILTPKQKQLYEQRKRAREEKEQKLKMMKEEKERKMQEEKLQRQREKEEKELARKKEREEKEEQRRLERESKEEARRKERELKEQQRLKKEEAKEEERRKKEESLRQKELEKEEIENKKKKAAAAFEKFFITNAKPSRSASTNEEGPYSKDDTENSDRLAFRPFQIRNDMKMAPEVRSSITEQSKSKLDKFLGQLNETVSEENLYLGELKSKKIQPVRWRRKVEDDKDEDDDVIVLDPLEEAGQAIVETRPPQQKYRVKFYLFHENRRPPYYGTWRKKTAVITPRRPLAQDKTHFDYEIDSDDEWEEEEPGEEIGSEDEKEIESEDDDYEVDNEWFVPHGHLSEEELQNDDDNQDTTREAQKAKLIVLQQEFAQEMKKKTEKIKPRLLGCIWQDENGNQPEMCPNFIWNSLNVRAMMFTSPPIIDEPEMPEVPDTSNSPPAEKSKRERLELDENLTKDLIHLLHGNKHSKAFLINEFLAHLEKTNDTVKNGEILIPHKSTIRNKIDEISAWQITEGYSKKNKKRKKLCWIVADDILKKYNLDELSQSNKWKYNLQPKFIEVSNEDNDEGGNTSAANELDSPISIAKKQKKFTIENLSRPIQEEQGNENNKTQEFMQQENKEKNNENEQKQKSINKTPIAKKRVALLMSGPRGQQFSPSTKNALISQFLKKDKDPPAKENDNENDGIQSGSPSSELIVLE